MSTRAVEHSIEDDSASRQDEAVVDTLLRMDDLVDAGDIKALDELYERYGCIIRDSLPIVIPEEVGEWLIRKTGAKGAEEVSEYVITRLMYIVKRNGIGFLERSAEILSPEDQSATFWKLTRRVLEKMTRGEAEWQYRWKPSPTTSKALRS